MKKLFAIILAIAMLASLALPVMADGDTGTEHTHSITIQETNPGHVFDVYQIFKGDVVEADTDNDNDTSTLDVVTLSNVTWGDKVDTSMTVAWGNESLTLLQALQSQTVNPNYFSHYVSIVTPDADTDDDVEDWNDVAAKIVEALSTNNSTAHAYAFADIVLKYITDETTTLTAVYEDNDQTKPILHYQATGLVDGYYLIKDNAKDDDIPSEIKTLYIMQLVKDVEMEPKDSEITVEKKIIEGGSEVDVCANNVGDVIDFRITGSMPSKLHNYDTFYYEFYDTMSKGLTLDPASIVLKTINGDNVVTVNDEYAKADDEDTDYLYEVKTSTDTAGKTILQVIIPDVHKLDATAEYSVVSTTKLRVEYKATVNKDAEIGNPGNPNDVKVVFDNDPYSDGRGETPEDTVLVFTFELDVNKINGTTGAKLNDVEFVLYRVREGKKQYAVVGTDNVLTGWTPYKDQEEIKNDNMEPKDAVPATVLKTATIKDADGNEHSGMFIVKGLDINVTYYLEETKAPDGYDKLEDPIEIVITGVYDETTAKVKDLKISINEGTAQNGDADKGVVDMTVVNNPGKELPSTGGMGTTLFYTVGGILVAAALILLVTKKRMSAEA